MFSEVLFSLVSCWGLWRSSRTFCYSHFIYTVASLRWYIPNFSSKCKPVTPALIWSNLQPLLFSLHWNPTQKKKHSDFCCLLPKKWWKMVEAFQEEHEEMCLHGVGFTQEATQGHQGPPSEGFEPIPFPCFMGFLLGSSMGRWQSLPSGFVWGFMSRFLFFWKMSSDFPYFFFVLVWMFMDKGWGKMFVFQTYDCAVHQGVYTV